MKQSLAEKAYKDNPTQNDWEVNIDSQSEHKSVLSLFDSEDEVLAEKPVKISL